MSIVRTTSYTLDLDKATTETRWDSVLTCGDNGADELRLTLMRGGAPATAGSLSAVLYGVRSDGTTTFTTGTVENSVVTVTLDYTFYAIPGRLELLVQLAEGTSVICTPLRVTAYVKSGQTDELVSAGESLGSLAELLAQIAACETATQGATEAAGAIENMTVAAEAVADGAPPTATISDVDGHKHILLGLQKGDKGDDGDKGDTGNVMFATFDVDIETGMLTMTTPDGYTGPSFALNEGTGMLEVSIEGSENETLLGKAAFVPKGAYAADVEYSRLDLVTNDGNCYIYINSTPGTGEALTDPDYWLMIAQRGKAYTILGQYNTLVELEAAVTDPDIGDQYHVGTTSPRNVYRWDGSAWIDDGVLQGPPGPEGPAGQDAVPRQTFVIELPAEDWSEDAPFTQTVEIEEMTADTDFIVDVILSDTLATAIDERKSYAYIDQAEGADGEVTFTCLSVKPAVDLTLQVRSV